MSVVFDSEKAIRLTQGPAPVQNRSKAIADQVAAKLLNFQSSFRLTSAALNDHYFGSDSTAYFIPSFLIPFIT